MTKTYELPNNKMLMADVDEKHHTATISVYALDDLVEAVNKTGHWIADVDKWGDIVTTVNGYICSECGEFNADSDKYCPSCGCHMIESQESEGEKNE